MAVTTKTTSTLNVLVQDANNGDVTFKLDNPVSPTPSLQDIRTAFGFVIQATVGPGQYENILCTKSGYELVSVLGAEKVTTTIQRETLD